MDLSKLSPAKLMLLNLLIAVSSAEGSVSVVTDSRDSTSTNSLRGAIIAANARARSQRSNTILLGGSRWPGAVSTFHLTIGGADETNAFTGDLDIVRGNLTIVGIGKNVTIDARRLGDRAFHVHKNATLWLQNISIVGAQAAPGANWEADGEPGGAIYNEGTLTMVNCAILGNSSGAGGYALGNDGQPSGGNGGGIYNTGKLNMARCLVSSNWCGGLAWFGGGGHGGGIWNAGAASLSYCVLDGNAASGAQTVQGMGLAGGSGGGVYNTGTLYLYNCTVRHNVSGQGAAGGLPGWSSGYTPGGSGGAAGGGGGVYSSGKVTLLRSVVSENRTGDGGDGGNGPGGGGAGGAGGSGGAIYSTGTLVLTGCTVSDNSTGHGGKAGSGLWTPGQGADGGNGGGIYTLGSLALTNCTVSRNGTGWGGDGGNGAEGGPPEALAAAGRESMLPGHLILYRARSAATRPGAAEPEVLETGLFISPHPVSRRCVLEALEETAAAVVAFSARQIPRFMRATTLWPLTLSAPAEPAAPAIFSSGMTTSPRLARLTLWPHLVRTAPVQISSAPFSRWAST